MDITLLKNNLKKFMTDHLLKNKGFGSRFFYAPTFTLAWLASEGDLTSELRQILITEYLAMDQNSSQFHFEFNHFAQIAYQTSTADLIFDKKLNEYQFRGTNCTNWRLLKLVVELKAGKNAQLILNETYKVLAERQLKSGFILDEPQVRSFQYHCFSLSLLGDIYEITKDEKLKKHFIKAAQFISRFILPNGDVFYIGRGQYQIFGIAPLLLSLLQAYELTAVEDYLADFNRCLLYLGKNQYADGRFPLVLTNRSEPLNSKEVLQDSNYWGWYGYNNLFDYLAFLGFYLQRIETKLKKMNTINLPDTSSIKKMNNYQDAEFQIVVQVDYTAIISKPGGAWSNDLPLPIIFSYKANKSITPCYGGEQYLPSLNRIEGIAYPASGNNSIRKSGRGKLLRNSWIWFSWQGIFKRKFQFNADHMTIRDYYFSPWAIKDRLLFDQSSQLVNSQFIQTPDLEIFSASRLYEGEIEYSASGPLKSYWSENNLKHWVVKIR